MATYSRHHSSSHPIPTKSLPITMPSKAPLATYPYPVSRAAASPPEYSDYSSGSSRHSSGGTYSTPSTSGRHSTARSHRSSNSSYAPSEYDEAASYKRGGDGRHHAAVADVDVDNMLADRMDRLDVEGRKIRMDRHVARQAQDSGRLNAASAELAELQALAQRRLKSARVNFAQGVEDAKEARRDLDYCMKKTEQMKEKASRKHPDAYAKTKSRTRSRHE